MSRRLRSSASNDIPSNLSMHNTTLPDSRSGLSPAVKSRRSHRKSRNGCAECRRRHIRCDKRRPVCANCDTGERQCTYPRPASPSSSAPDLAGSEMVEEGAHHETISSHTVQSPAFEELPTRTPDTSGTPQQQHHQLPPRGRTPPLTDSTPVDTAPYVPTTTTGSVFSPMDLILFHHAETEMNYSGLGVTGQFQLVMSIAMRHSLDAPYLLDQALALAAIHLSMHLPSSTTGSSSDSTATATPSAAAGPTSPAAAASPTSLLSNLTSSALRTHATFLQSRAVASFNRLTAEEPDSDDASSSIARFLFSGVLSLHSQAETFSVLREDNWNFHKFIDSFVDCFNLYRGVRTATGRPMHEFLRQSELGPTLLTLNVTSEVDWRETPRGTECDSLSRLLDASDLGASSLEACRAAVHSLQWSFDMYNGLSMRDGPHAACAFPVTAPPQYVDVLRKHRPEALIILAFHGVLLHRCRQYWIFGDAGARMILAISSHLGTYWQSSIRWPLHVIETERD